jgi:hypothetical protein
LKKDAAEAAKVKADVDAKAKRQIEEDEKKAALTSRPQVAKPAEPKPVARPATEFKPETSDDEQAEPVRRREVPEEVNHGA